MKIFCIGMNYAEHNKELHDTLLRTEKPVIFLKPDSALLKDGKPFFVPDFMGRIDYETEVVVRICKLGKSVAPQFAHRYYDAVTLGIDFTAREMQRELAAQGHPWDVAKGFDGSAYIGEWIDKELLPPVGNLRFHMNLNGQTVQQGFTGDMLRSIDDIICHVSQYYTLKTGDLLFSGTPAGVGPVRPNDHIEAWLEERKVLDVRCK